MFSGTPYVLCEGLLHMLNVVNVALCAIRQASGALIWRPLQFAFGLDLLL